MTSPILVTNSLVAGYVRGLPIVQGVSLEVSRGEVVTIIGPNGAGKSTFLKAIAGLVVREGGQIRLDGQDVTDFLTHALVKAGIAFVPQTHNIFASLTVHENLVLGGHTLGAELSERIDEAYARFPALAQRRSSLGRVLSGGERQMLAIARALMVAPKVIMLDEPSAGLSPKVADQVFSDLRRLASTNVAVLIVEQNARAALLISDRGYLLTEGRNRIDGVGPDLMRDPAVAEAFFGVRSQPR
jgi:branched-chain amino acid transport system ATP-binding protein